MSNALYPYYLQQMGIETWIIRKPSIETTKLWVIGEGLDLNQQAAGLLTKMLNSIGLLPEDMQIKSRVTPDLMQEIINRRPPLILSMGQVATQCILNHDTQQTFNRLRGNIYHLHHTRVVVSDHPMDLLQHPADKKRAFQDLLLIQGLLAQLSC